MSTSFLKLYAHCFKLAHSDLTRTRPRLQPPSPPFRPQQQTQRLPKIKLGVEVGSENRKNPLDLHVGQTLGRGMWSSSKEFQQT